MIFCTIIFFRIKLSLLNRIYRHTKIMKKITAFLGFSLLVLCTSAQVQRKAIANDDSGRIASSDNKNSRYESGRKEGNGNMFKELNLTADEKRKMREIQLANKAKKEFVLNNASLSGDQKKEKLKEIQQDGLNNLQQVLSDEQMGKLKALRREKKISNKSMEQ